ncbi:hypothetical protein [Pseudarthrobacter sp. NamE5]|uniref:hypothetical protein n=1 Tax=Pseudarthrobacter sp. NamE5 TaxID=2576839 RepID=UPI00197AED64|nr:hypothetical protein [Pseudarthrobacter sp. NamE5]
MSIYLVGAGPDPVSFPAVFDRFIGDVQQRAKTAGREFARVAVVVHDRGGNPGSVLPAYVEPLTARAPLEVVPVLLGSGETAEGSLFHGVDGLVVGGGLTPAYHQLLGTAAPIIAGLVDNGVPYLGFSAGAMIAPGRALIGGYRVDGIEVCGEECGEGLDQLDIREGLGLTGFAVDVHAAQAGTLSRAVAAVAAGLVDRAVAVDEGTALVLPAARDEGFKVLGAGNCWDIRRPAQESGTISRPSVTVSVLSPLGGAGFRPAAS